MTTETAQNNKPDFKEKAQGFAYHFLYALEDSRPKGHFNIFVIAGLGLIAALGVGPMGVAATGLVALIGTSTILASIAAPLCKRFEDKKDLISSKAHWSAFALGLVADIAFCLAASFAAMDYKKEQSADRLPPVPVAVETATVASPLSAKRGVLTAVLAEAQRERAAARHALAAPAPRLSF